MRRAFEEFGFAPALVPAADVYEADGEFVVEIELSDHTLTVKGEKVEKTEKAFRLHERLERAFERRFALPADADTERVTATFEKGVLELHAPKVATAKPRKVAIGKP